jgi:hypothetical protein
VHDPVAECPAFVVPGCSRWRGGDLEDAESEAGISGRCLAYRLARYLGYQALELALLAGRQFLPW